MVAVFFMAFFGLLAVVGSQIIGNTAVSRQEVDAVLSAQVDETFHKIEKIITNSIIPQNLWLAPQGCSGNPLPTQLAAYVCAPQLLGAFSWSNHQNGTTDPWGQPLLSLIKTENIAILGSASQAIVMPVSAVVLISGGPDRTVHPDTRSALEALKSRPASPDNIRFAHELYAQRADNDLSTPQNPADDDIILIFTSQESQQKMWGAVQAALEDVGTKTLSQYQALFSQFSGNDTLKDVYTANLTQFFSGTNISLSDTNLDLWRTQSGVARPKFNSGIFDTTAAAEALRSQWGITEPFNVLQRMGLRLSVNAGTTDDMLQISMKNSAINPSPWRFSPAGFVVEYRAD
jgi:hypothetical protein